MSRRLVANPRLSFIEDFWFVLDLGSYETRIMNSVGEVVVRTKTPHELQIERGVVADIAKTAFFIRTELKQYLITKYPDWIVSILLSSLPFSPWCVAVVPESSSVLEREAMRRSCIQAGFSRVKIVSQLQGVVSYLARLNPNQSQKTVVLGSLGHGVCEFGVFSDRKLVSSISVPELSGRELDSQLLEVVREKCGIEIDLAQIQLMKQSLGAISGYSGLRTSFILKGKDIESGSLISNRVELRQVQSVFDAFVDVLEESLQELLSAISSSDLVGVFEQGVLLAGGGSQINGLAQVLTQRVGVPVEIFETPDLTALSGAWKARENE